MATGSDRAAELYKERANIQRTNGKEFIAEISPKPGDTVLDIGCGTGELTAYLAELVGPSGKVIGVDPDGTRIKLAQETYQHVKNLTFVEGNCYNFPDVGMAKYDLVFSNYVFHWIFHKEKALGRVWHSLKPGGKVAVQAPSAMATLLDKVITELFTDKVEQCRGLWCFEGKEALESYHLRNGFEVLKSSEFILRPSFPSLVDFCKWLEGVTHGMTLTDAVPKEQIELMAANLHASEKEGNAIIMEFMLMQTVAVKPLQERECRATSK